MVPAVGSCVCTGHTKTKSNLQPGLVPLPPGALAVDTEVLSITEMKNPSVLAEGVIIRVIFFIVKKHLKQIIFLMEIKKKKKGKGKERL